MKFKANFLYKPGNFQMEFCRQLHEDEPPGLRLKELLPLLQSGGPMFLCHEEADTSVLAENLQRLTGAGQEDHSALLNARVSEICMTSEGMEIVLTDVAPEELVRFNEDYDAFMAAEQAMGPVDVQPSASRPPIQYPFLQGCRPLGPEDLDIQERIGADDGQLVFWLDVLADEEAVFGAQLTDEREETYVQAYASYNERTGQADDTLDIVQRSPGGDTWFSCALTEKMQESLKQAMDTFCMKRYGEHLPEPSEGLQPQMGQTM